MATMKVNGKAKIRPIAGSRSTLFLMRMRTKEIAKTLGKYIPLEELFPYRRKSRSSERMSGSDFRQALK